MLQKSSKLFAAGFATISLSGSGVGFVTICNAYVTKNKLYIPVFSNYNKGTRKFSNQSIKKPFFKTLCNKLIIYFKHGIKWFSANKDWILSFFIFNTILTFTSFICLFKIISFCKLFFVTFFIQIILLTLFSDKNYFVILKNNFLKFKEEKNNRYIIFMIYFKLESCYLDLITIFIAYIYYNSFDFPAIEINLILEYDVWFLIVIFSIQFFYNMIGLFRYVFILICNLMFSNRCFTELQSFILYFIFVILFVFINSIVILYFITFLEDILYLIITFIISLLLVYIMDFEEEKINDYQKFICHTINNIPKLSLVKPNPIKFRLYKPVFINNRKMNSRMFF